MGSVSILSGGRVLNPTVRARRRYGRLRRQDVSNCACLPSVCPRTKRKKPVKSILHMDRLRTKDLILAQVYLLSKLVGALQVEEWSADLAVSNVVTWFEDTVRPVSPWRWTSLWTDMLRHAIRGPEALSRLLAALPHLARYLCDAPRKRRQQAAYARQWLNASTLSMDVPHRVACYESILAQVRAHALGGRGARKARLGEGECTAQSPFLGGGRGHAHNVCAGEGSALLPAARRV
jgi:hypothetical protein